MRKEYKILIGKPEGWRPVGRGLGVDGRIKLKSILKKLGGEDMDGTHLAQNTVEWCDFIHTVMNIRFP